MTNADAAYVKAFQDYGIDVDALHPEEAAQRIRARPVQSSLVGALDHLVQVRKELRKLDPESWQHLVEMAQAADPDEYRRRVRSALLKRDTHLFRQLPRARGQAPETKSS